MRAFSPPFTRPFRSPCTALGPPCELAWGGQIWISQPSCACAALPTLQNEHWAALPFGHVVACAYAALTPPGMVIVVAPAKIGRHARRQQAAACTSTPLLSFTYNTATHKAMMVYAPSELYILSLLTARGRRAVVAALYASCEQDLSSNALKLACAWPTTAQGARKRTSGADSREATSQMGEAKRGGTTVPGLSWSQSRPRRSDSHNVCLGLLMPPRHPHCVC